MLRTKKPFTKGMKEKTNDLLIVLTGYVNDL